LATQSATNQLHVAPSVTRQTCSSRAGIRRILSPLKTPGKLAGTLYLIIIQLFTSSFNQVADSRADPGVAGRRPGLLSAGDGPQNKAQGIERVKYTLRQLVLRGLRFYAPSHLGTLLGVAVASAVLVGALAVGDSVRESLRDMALDRVGRVSFALAATDHFFRAALADDVRPEISDGLAAAVLQLPGTAVTPDESARANQVQVLGVDEHFFALARESSTLAFQQPDTVLLNAPLAAQLHVKAGDAIVLHVQKPSLLSQESPLSPQEDVATGLRLTVAGIVSDAQFGRFSLQASQVPPSTAFLPLAFLEGKTGLEGKVNLLLTADPGAGAAPAELLRRHWTLADAGLELRPVTNGWELRTDRVFIDPAIVQAARALTPPPGPQLFLTYFVNELRDGPKATPYSMVTAAEASALTPNMRDDGIMINQWLADDLQAGRGDSLRLSYYVPGTSHRLEEKQAKFRVSGIVTMTGLAGDRTLMPDFPGIAKAEKTENWDAGFAIDLQKIRPKDEQYWKQYRGTPKAFITLAAGQKLWGNRFGNVTSIRFKADQVSGQSVRQGLARALDPAAIGLVFQPLRERALAASSQAEDFGGLFIGFSFFLIVAALILLSLLFHFGMEKRATEIGVLLALGWPPRLVRRLFLLEGIAIAAVGSAVGAVGGVIYAKGILWGLATLWRSAVADSTLRFHPTAGSIAGGAVAGVVVSTIVIWFAVRRQSRRPARELLERGDELEGAKPGRAWGAWVAGVSGAAAFATVGGALAKHHTADVESFFSAGALLLVAGIALVAVLFRALARRAASGPLTLAGLGLRGCTRRPKRSLATVALLTSGTFLIVAVAANKLDASRDGNRRSSGTGGFALIGQSSLPIVQDLNSPAGRHFFGLTDSDLQGAQVVPLRVHDGDDASCLNLNRAQTPRLLGVDPEALQSRGAFTFSKRGSWKLLEMPEKPDVIPAVADDATIEWGLHKKLGDTLDYVDSHGHGFKVRLVGSLGNSILQGSLIIDSAAFTRRFPDETGWRMFLIDVPAQDLAKVRGALTTALQDRGLELTPAADRLNAFNAVQNTYLDTFQVLGGLGLLLGSAGLGVVVLRNVLERRGELAVLQAMGFRPRALRRLVLSEHAALECLGLLAGIVAALVAVLPALLSLAAPVSYGSLGVTLGLVFASGILWTWLAARLALRGDLLPALRNE
jgi:putative ABC transport system permease protein